MGVGNEHNCFVAYLHVTTNGQEAINGQQKD